MEADAERRIRVADRPHDNGDHSYLPYPPQVIIFYLHICMYPPEIRDQANRIFMEFSSQESRGWGGGSADMPGKEGKAGIIARRCGRARFPQDRRLFFSRDLLTRTSLADSRLCSLLFVPFFWGFFFGFFFFFLSGELDPRNQFSRKIKISRIETLLPAVAVIG